jgi:uncharacterized membrane protein
MNMEAGKARLESIDTLRGLIMIVMALDHTRDFVHSAAFHFQPEDLTQTTPAIFFTRWITHFCAPVFMLCAGLGAWFYGRRGKPALSKFLLTRGLWLVVLELTVLRFGFFFSLTEGPLLLTILWALGLCMILLAALIWLPMRVIAVLSVALMLFHNLFDSVKGGVLWTILHRQGVFTAGGEVFVVAYPLIPWIGVMAAGYCLGQVFALEERLRRRILFRWGVALTLAFFVIRGINVYGDPTPWTHPGGIKTVLSFLRCQKYPPSLDFLLMTLGPSITLLAFLPDRGIARTNPLLVFGRVPLFYFVLHFYVIHLSTIVLSMIRYGTPRYGLGGSPSFSSMKGFPPDFGYSLGVVYLVWIVVVVAVYPACLWFSRIKERRRDWWLGYL